MIKSLLFLVLMMFQSVIPELKKLREHYPLMSKQESSVIAIKELALSSKQINQNLKLAYYAAAEMSSAQYKLNPASKIKTFNEGKKILEKAILADSANIEARYIRYTIQQNAPNFLGYTKNRASDRQFLIQHLGAIKITDKELYSSIYAYLLLKSSLTEKEKTQINS